MRADIDRTPEVNVATRPWSVSIDGTQHETFDTEADAISEAHQILTGGKISDEELDSFVRPGGRTGPTIMATCDNPDCARYRKMVPVAADPVAQDEVGRHQTHQCAACGTVMKIYTGEQGELFQENVFADPATEAGE